MKTHKLREFACAFTLVYVPDWFVGVRVASHDAFLWFVHEMTFKHALPLTGLEGDTSVFPLADLQFAMGWARVAPGFGGWRLAVCNTSAGELVEIAPPGSDYPVFLVLPRAGHVDVVHEQPAETGGGQLTIATCANLRDAVLLVCPLDGATVAGISDEAPWPV